MSKGPTSSPGIPEQEYLPINVDVHGTLEGTFVRIGDTAFPITLQMVHDHRRTDVYRPEMRERLGRYAVRVVYLRHMLQSLDKIQLVSDQISVNLRRLLGKIPIRGVIDDLATLTLASEAKDGDLDKIAALLLSTNGIDAGRLETSINQCEFELDALLEALRDGGVMVASFPDTNGAVYAYEPIVGAIEKIKQRRKIRAEAKERQGKGR